jgi:hypothetical protein
MSDVTEQQVVALLRVLRPAPVAWVAAACEVPRFEHELARVDPVEPGASPEARSPRMDRDG